MLRCSNCGSERGFNALKTYVFQVELNEEALVEETHGIKHDLDHEPYIPGTLSCRNCGSPNVEDTEADEPAPNYAIFLFSPKVGISEPLSYEEIKERAASQVDCLRRQGLPAFYAAKPCYEEIACQQKAF